MGELRDIYIKAGFSPETLEHSPKYLSQLALDGAMDVNNRLLGNKDGFKHIRELAGILEKYQLKDTDTFISSQDFPYIPLWRAINGDNLDRDHISELALKMKLLRAELESVHDSNRLEGLIPFLVNLSKEFQLAAVSY